MNTLLVIVDLKQSCNIAVVQSIQLAKYKNANITMCYIAQTSEEAHSAELKTKLEVYTSKLESSGVTYKVHIGTGDYKNELSDYVGTNRPDLVIAATHGKTGLKQNWFGSNIYHLVKSLPVGTLVMSDYTAVSLNGFSKILLPVGAHSDYIKKVELSCEMLAPEGKIIIFNIIKHGVPVLESISENVQAAKDLLTKNKVQFDLVNFESVKFSVGYSRETLQYAKDNGIDLISIMTTPSGSYAGVSTDIDKENLLLNKDGIPVLCVN